jgi:serine/threonine-protein kinase PpkA
MANILVVEDDPATREVLTLYLQAAGHKVTSGEDGLDGLRKAVALVPDLIVSDVNMPNLDGFGLLSAVRGNNKTASIPFVFLTMFDDRDTFRRAMGLGANDLINKPIKRDELLDTVNARLHRASTRGATLTPASAKAAGVSAIPPRAPATIAPPPSRPLPVQTMVSRSMPDTGSFGAVDNNAVKETRIGTVLFSDVRNYTMMCEILSPEEVAEMMNTFFTRACEPIQDQNGWVVKLLGDGIVAMFDSYASAANDHAERAMKASLLMIAAARRFQGWINQRYRGRGLPEFGIGVGINTGEVVVCKIGAGPNAETTILGDTVNIAARLEAKTKDLGWSVVSALSTFKAAGPRFLTGRRGTIDVKGKSETVDVIELTGLMPKPNTPDEQLVFYHEISEAIAANTAIAEIRANEALSKSQPIPAVRGDGGTSVGGATGTYNAGAFRKGEAVIEIEGYHIIRKLGEGGMSKVYLADHLETKQQHVLKVLSLNLEDESESDVIQRFIQEYALLSQVTHPNVATIFGHGFTDTHAYISMEFFPNGDLRLAIKKGIQVNTALDYLRQTTLSLGAIHQIGIVHRDLKPDNLMLRADGSLGLADFGIAKQLSTMVTKTRHGEVFGTPYYLSPEQALGRPVDQRSDLYSLGVMFFEMLTGDKPYHADDPQGLLFKHVHGDLPVLPSHMAKFQPVINRLLAKAPDQRFSGAQQLLAALQPYFREAGISMQSAPPASGSNPAFERTQPLR